MTKEEAIAGLEDIKEGDDPQGSHGNADAYLLAYLRANGAADLAAAYNRALERAYLWNA